MIKKQLLTLFCGALLTNTIFSQSPTDLTADVDLTAACNCSYFPPYGFFSSETHIINAFNFARRAEETQLSLTANSLGNLTLPAGYSSKPAVERGLYILNQERIARAGVMYGGVTSLGLPYEGTEIHLVNIAQAHTNDMITNNFFAHVSPTTGLSPYQRIDQSPTYSGGCREFMTYAENIYVSCTSGSTTPTYTMEQAIFSWIYRDASSSWGHRRAALIQASDAYGATGFTNNVGSASDEGHLGLGIGTRVYNGTASAVCGGTFNAHYVTMNIADPKPSCIANYTVPIELMQFAAAYRGDYVHINWTVANEEHVAYYAVERSTDGKTFYTISKIANEENDEEIKRYAIDDFSPLKGTAYYRLVEIDNDGMQHYSQNVAVKSDEIASFVAFPNPTTDLVYIDNYDEKNTQYEVINNLGHIVKTMTLSENSNSVSLGELNAGVYFIRSNNGAMQRIIKY